MTRRSNGAASRGSRLGALWSPKRVLALAPHTDDVEIGAGGFVSRLVRAGAEVHYVAFSIARESVPAGFPPDILAKEVKRATARLGIPRKRLRILDYPVRRFPEHRQPILEELIRLRKEINPDLVLVHAGSDVHQDHRTVHEEAVRAFRHTTLLGYELPWNNLEFRTQSVVALTETEMRRKIHALAAYRSQRHRRYASEEVIRGLAQMRGLLIGARYAEAFEVVRWALP